MVADPTDVDDAQRACGDEVEVLAGRSTTRGSATPARCSSATTARRVGVDFRFTGWGETFTPFDRDATIAARRAGAPRRSPGRRRTDLALEGGCGRGRRRRPARHDRAVPAEPEPQPDLDRDEIEARPRATYLGVDRVVWLADGIAEDDGTDGHVDNVVAFVAPGRCLLQGCDDPANPNHAIAADNRAGSSAAGIEVDRDAGAARTRRSTAHGCPVPYVNLYPVQRRGDRADRRRPGRRRGARR